MAASPDTFLIVGGTTKSGTTSAYEYLAAHPEVCACRVKEPRFFLEPDYPSPPVTYGFEDGVERYLEYFSHGTPDQVRMEATPDYLYSRVAAARIRDALPDPRIVFVLRDPIQRILSWYRFSLQVAHIPQETTLRAFVEYQLEDPEDPRHPKHHRAVHQGRYAEFLGDWLEALGRERVHVVRLPDLSSSPREVLGEICDFAGISSGFYETYTFEVANASLKMRHAGLHKAYTVVQRSLRHAFHGMPRVLRPLRAVKRSLDPVYLRLNSAGRKRSRMPRDLADRLVEYYREDNLRLSELLGGEGPYWDLEGSAERAVAGGP